MDIVKKFREIRVYAEDNKPSLHKPVLLLFTLSQCYQNKNRLIAFEEIDRAFQQIFANLALVGNSENSHYPFGKLENDGIWEITDSKNLKRTSVGHLSKKELLEKNICGGFIEEIYDSLRVNNDLINHIVQHILMSYIDINLHESVISLLKLPNKNAELKYDRNKSMALIGNQTFALSRWWASKTIELVKIDRKIFSKNKLREIRRELIAGKNQIDGIQGWMLAAQLICNIKAGEYELTNFSRALLDNDPKLDKSASWWAIHVSICFSERRDPYYQFFCNLDNLSKDWQQLDTLKEKIYSKIDSAAKGSIDPNLDGVLNMFKDNRPLADLGLIEISKIREEGISIRLGSPKLTDVCVIHALAMLRFHQLKSRSTVTFSELMAIGLANFLCSRPEDLRLQLRRMHQSQQWQNYFSFNEAVNNDSLAFADGCDPKQTLLLLLQQGEDTWL